MSRLIKSTVLMALIVASALVVPAAQAAPIDPPIATDAVQPAPFQSPQVQHGLTSTFTSESSSAGVNGDVVSSHTTPDGFNWGDAGIGAGAMLVLIGLGTAAVLIPGRTRARRGRPAPAS
jgi:hypothetical protein